jgi:hypothetical protein
MTGLPIGVARVWPIGTHELRITGPSEWSVSEIGFEQWALTYADDDDEEALGEPPRVTGVEVLDEDLAELLLRLDSALVPGLGYMIEPPTTDTHTIADTAFSGPRRNLALERSPDDRALLDIDAPVVREDGIGGTFTLDETRDWALTGGVETITKVIWSRLLEGPGARPWAPWLGSGLKLKTLRPVDVRDAQKRIEDEVRSVPYVRDASVQLTWTPGGMMTVVVRAQTDFGRVETSREVGP